MLSCLPAEPDTDILSTLVSALRLCVEVVEDLAVQLLDANAIKLVGEALLKLLTESHQRIAKREEQKKDQDFDEETLARVIGENEEEDELNFLIAQCMGAFIKSHKILFLPTFDVLLPEILRMLAPQSIAGTRKIAIFIFDDIIEFIGLPAARYFQQFVPPLLAYTLDPNENVRQAAAYGLGMCAQHGGDAFGPFADDAARQLLTGIGSPESKRDDCLTATDNMIAALARICRYQQRIHLIPSLLAALPLASDSSEGPALYEFLIGLVEINNPQVLGPNMENLPKIISIFLRILGTDFVNAPLTLRIHGIFRKIAAHPNLQQIAQQLKPQQQQTLTELLTKLSTK